MMGRAQRTMAVLAFALVSCSSPVIPASTPTSGVIPLRLYTTTSTIPLLNDLVSEYSVVMPDIVIEAISGNFETMFTQIMERPSSYLLTNHLPTDAVDVQAWPIAQDGIAVVVHPDNPTTALSSAQLRSVYLGHVGNWKEIGGFDNPLTVLSREDGAGIRVEFEKLLLGERLTTQSALVMPSSQAMLTTVTQQRGSIGYLSMGYLGEGIKALAVDEILPTPTTVTDNTYPLRRPALRHTLTTMTRP
jgi:phosphate transport system substrate-binding protein